VFENILKYFQTLFFKFTFFEVFRKRKKINALQNFMLKIKL